MSRPLRSTPITGASPLLRAGPPARAATVLNTSGFGRPVLSLFTHPPGNRTSGSIDTRLPTFHAEAAVRARAASMPDTAWPIHGHPPGSSRRHLTAPVLMPATCFDTSTAVHSRSPSRTPPDALKGTPSPRRSPRQSSANAARGGLKPPTARRLRGATKPSSPAQHRFQQGHLHNQTSPSALVAHLNDKLRVHLKTLARVTPRGRVGVTWSRSWRCRPSLRDDQAESRSRGRNAGVYRSTRRSARPPTDGEEP